MALRKLEPASSGSGDQVGGEAGGCGKGEQTGVRSLLLKETLGHSLQKTYRSQVDLEASSGGIGSGTRVSPCRFSRLSRTFRP